MDSITSGSIDVAFDKGTLDAMIHGSPWSPPQDVVDKTAAYIQEIRAVEDMSAADLMPAVLLSEHRRAIKESYATSKGINY
ncbi:hypothetical protein HYQ46_013461 [Verticillium longisporum]|nr:hypothetical protein HYQ46_013461 [Verticillium longisporum]